MTSILIKNYREATMLHKINRREMLATSFALSWNPVALADAPGAIISGEVIGRDKMLTVVDGPEGRILAFDSSTYLENHATQTNDIVVIGSYCGTRVLAPIFTRGVKGIIATDAGIGKDEAGVSGLKHGETIGVPVASIGVMSAETSNGRQTLLGRISRANSQAQALGVFIGQNAWEAALLLTKAPQGKSIPTSPGVEEAPVVVEQTSNGRIWATPGSTAIKENISLDVFCSGANSSRVMSDGALRMNAKGAIANDAGIARNNSAVEGVFILGEKGVPAASVSTLSARLGEGLSTWDHGIISVANETALRLGVKIGMSAQEAARIMVTKA